MTKQLNFHADKNLFMDWLMLNEMTSGEIVLWHTLMTIGNRLGRKTIFNAPTSTVISQTGLSKQGVMNARKKLFCRGFIKYENGKKNKAPIYEMIPLKEVIQQNLYSDENQALTLNLTQDLTHHLTDPTTQNLTIHKDKREKERRRGGRGREENQLFKTYEENIGKLTPLIQEELLKWISIFDEVIVEEAIRITVMKGGRTFSYAEKILQQWKNAGLQTFEEVQGYELEKELEKSKKVIPFRKRVPEGQAIEDLYAELLEEDF